MSATISTAVGDIGAAVGCMRVDADGAVRILLGAWVPPERHERLIAHALSHVPEGVGYYRCDPDGTYDHWT